MSLDIHEGLRELGKNSDDREMRYVLMLEEADFALCAIRDAIDLDQAKKRAVDSLQRISLLFMGRDPNIPAAERKE